MNKKNLWYAFFLALAIAVGMYFGYKMGVKMKHGDNRTLYPISE